MFLGPIEATFLIVSVALEPDTDLATTEAFGEPGLVAPTKLAGLVLTTLRPHPRQLIKALLTRVGHVAMQIAPSQANKSIVAVVPLSRATVRCSTNVDFGTRRTFPRRGFFEPAFAAVTLLADKHP
jgi:hypothetical protein